MTIKSKKRKKTIVFMRHTTIVHGTDIHSDYSEDQGKIAQRSWIERKDLGRTSSIRRSLIPCSKASDPYPCLGVWGGFTR